MECFECGNFVNRVVLGHYQAGNGPCIVCPNCGCCSHIYDKDQEHHWTVDGEVHIRIDGRCVIKEVPEFMEYGMPRAYLDPILPSGIDLKKTCRICFSYKSWHPKPPETTLRMKEKGIAAHRFNPGIPKRGIIHAPLTAGSYRAPLCLDVEWEPGYIGMAIVGIEDMVNCPRCLEKINNVQKMVGRIRLLAHPKFKARWFKIKGSKGKRFIRAFNSGYPPTRSKR